MLVLIAEQAKLKLIQIAVHCHPQLDLESKALPKPWIPCPPDRQADFSGMTWGRSSRQTKKKNGQPREATRFLNYSIISQFYLLGKFSHNRKILHFS